MQLLPAFKAGIILTFVLDEGLAQGVGTGIQGFGGPGSAVHILNEGIFAMGAISNIFPIGLLHPLTGGLGTLKVSGAAPIGQLNCAPSVRNLGIIPPELGFYPGF